MDNTEQLAKYPVLDSDSPIKHPKEDLFGYAEFAKRVAKTIMEYPCDTGMVLSINGKWGAGKSSFQNLIIHHLRTSNWGMHNTEACIIEYSPWWMIGNNDLIVQIMKNFYDAASNFKISKDFVNKLGKYIDSIEVGCSINTGVVSLGAKLKSIFNKKSNLDKIVNQKKELSDILVKSFHRFVYFVDDIDRLQPSELQDLFKAIKGVGDLPKVIFVLAFDHEVVAKTLSHHMQISGDEYIEKIIQAKFDIPMLEEGALENYLVQRLEKLFAYFPDMEIDKDRWHSQALPMAKFYLSHARNVNRLTNSIISTILSVYKEVDFVDYFVIETLRLFEPKAYSLIKNNIYFFTGRRGSLNTKAKTLCRELLDDVNFRVSKDKIYDILADLFPVLEGTQKGEEWFRQWRRECRVCNIETAHTYFTFSMPKQTVSKTETRDWIDLVKEDHVLAENRLLELKQNRLPSGRSVAIALCERVTDYINEWGCTR